MKNIAIIPARGGSKRLPRKNVLPLNGKPLLAYSIEAALESQIFDDVVVTSDDPEALSIAEQYGVVAAIRPPHLATDTATVAQTCLALLKERQAAGSTYDIVCCLYATSPLRTPDDIFQTLSLLNSVDVNFARSICTYPISPWQAQLVRTNGELEYMWPEHAKKKSQELQELVIDNGSIYAAKIDAFFENECFTGSGTRGFRMPFFRSIDIDTKEDFELVKQLIRQSK